MNKGVECSLLFIRKLPCLLPVVGVVGGGVGGLSITVNCCVDGVSVVAGCTQRPRRERSPARREGRSAGLRGIKQHHHPPGFP